MEQKKEVQRRKQGDHYNRNETKIAIIEFVLSNIKEDNEPGIPEPKIREHLQSKFGITDIENIRNHLKDLSGNIGKACLKKFPYKKPGLSNHWDITNIEHLKNIQNKFKGIQLNKYEKSLMIVLKKDGYNILTFEGIRFYVRLLLSSSFFNACIDTNIEILYDRVKMIFVINNPLPTKTVESNLEFLYSSYTKRYPNIELSFESFRSMIMQMTKREEISDVNSPMLMEMPLIEQKPFAERFMEIWEKDLLGLPEEKSDEMHQETMEKDLRDYWNMNLATHQLKELNSIFEKLRHHLLFKEYLHQDILNSIASEEEINYAIETQAIEDSFNSRFKEDNDDPAYCVYLIGDETKQNLEHDSRILAKHKHPSIFRDFYKDPLDTWKYIIEFLNMRTDEVKKRIPLYGRGYHDWTP